MKYFARFAFLTIGTCVRTQGDLFSLTIVDGQYPKFRFQDLPFACLGPQESQGSHSLEKALNFEGCLEKALNYMAGPEKPLNLL